MCLVLFGLHGCHLSVAGSVVSYLVLADMADISLWLEVRCLLFCLAIVADISLWLEVRCVLFCLDYMADISL